jgi:predicted metalloprotease
MKWRTGRRSTNIEDRRGRRITGARMGKVGGGMLVLAVGVTLLFARDVGGVLNLVTSNMGLKWYSNSNQLGATIFDRCGSGEI